MAGHNDDIVDLRDSPQDKYVSTEQWEQKTACIRKRKRKKRSRKKEKAKPEWERDPPPLSEKSALVSIKWFVYGSILILSLMVGGFSMMHLSDKYGEKVWNAPTITIPISPPSKEDKVSRFMRDAEKVARVFISEIDEEKRLTLVRDVENVRNHLERYSEDARTFSIVSMKMMGYSELNGRCKCAFSVKLMNGNYRLLNILETEQGLKVDWDSYARYCSSSWEDLYSGKVTEAEVRVFVQPADHSVEPFDDAGKWMSFQLVDADSERVIYGYVSNDSRLAGRMLARVAKSRSSRQHMTLQIRGNGESSKRGLFIVDKLLAVGWVK